MEAATPTDAQRRTADDTAQPNRCCPLCTDHIVGFGLVRPTIPARLRDQQVRVRSHSRDGDTERRRAWTVHGVDPAKLIVLDERDTTI